MGQVCAAAHKITGPSMMQLWLVLVGEVVLVDYTHKAL